MIPLVLPEVTTMVQKLLTRGFPRAYQDRLQETEPERALVSQVGWMTTRCGVVGAVLNVYYVVPCPGVLVCTVVYGGGGTL